MLAPVLLLFFAILTAAVMAYGTHPAWAQFPNGLEFIMLTRRLQWPLVAVALILCLILLGLIIAGRRRAWWLIGLGPVLALFVHRFASDPAANFQCIENPTFVTASEAPHIADEDWVVALQFGDAHYAYPFAALFQSPVVIHAEHDSRVAVLWSPYANRAVAVPAGRDIRAGDLEVVGMPGNALLLYNRRLGQFINGVTGRAPDGGKADGFGEPLATVTKQTWRTWRTIHPDGRVLLPASGNYASLPRVPIRPAFPLPASYSSISGEMIVLVGATQPLAVPASSVTAEPLNVSADGVPAVAVRDPDDGVLRAFERRVGDLQPRLRRNSDPRRAKALFVDDETGVGWNALGVAVDGPSEFRGKRLRRMAVDGDLQLGVMKYAYRDDLSTFSGAGTREATRPEP